MIISQGHEACLLCPFHPRTACHNTKRIYDQTEEPIQGTAPTQPGVGQRYSLDPTLPTSHPTLSRPTDHHPSQPHQNHHHGTQPTTNQDTPNAAKGRTGTRSDDPSQTYHLPAHATQRSQRVRAGSDAEQRSCTPGSDEFRAAELREFRAFKTSSQHRVAQTVSVRGAIGSSPSPVGSLPSAMSLPQVYDSSEQAKVTHHVTLQPLQLPFNSKDAGGFVVVQAFPSLPLSLSPHQIEIASVPGPFGVGLLVSSVDGRAMVTATDLANPIFRDVLTSVFNNSLLLDITLTTHNTHVFYFVKENFWKASEDMTQLNRLGGEVNITVHEPSASAPLQADEEKNDNFVDVKLHSAWAVVHIRYGTTVVQEKKRLLKHAKKVAIRRAWSEERERLSSGLPGSVEWSSSETEELLSRGSVSSYTAKYLYPPEEYPALLDDPTNVRFFRNTKRTRRNSKTRRSHRCRKWWRGLC
ncbi:hypothetical protein C7M84_019764 [Penaeus vannamei]|uniref:Tox-GHH domain-containing protein n=1 Tax=Penaeus vannamei TaxID=6689 RepID=A0A3R7QB97_PENVA|nr:hypothetical protein C7M84_019764 [Penaeus vannamei]